MEKTWRWWGPEDIISLKHVRQAGATGIVTALHDIPAGEVWTAEAIAERLQLITADTSLGLRWSVVESLPVHEDIKIGVGPLEKLFDAYRTSIRNLANAGVRTICYNFMPVLDWSRTELAFPLPGGGHALRFNMHEFAALDCFMLRRRGSDEAYSQKVLSEARAWFDESQQEDRDRLLATVMAGLPGAFERYDIEGLRKILTRYEGVNADRLRENLTRFLNEVVPVAEEEGIRLAVHPDDPPWSLLGLPRIVSNEKDLEYLTSAVASPANGITLCTGSLGAGNFNNLPRLARRFARHINFSHMRNVKRLSDGSFYEAEHLEGDTDMVSVVKALMEEQARRKNDGRTDWRIPFRPDHGAALAGDIDQPHHPGYSYIGRLKGLAELSGIIAAEASASGRPV